MGISIWAWTNGEHDDGAHEEGGAHAEERPVDGSPSVEIVPELSIFGDSFKISAFAVIFGSVFEAIFPFARGFAALRDAGVELRQVDILGVPIGFTISVPSQKADGCPESDERQCAQGPSDGSNAASSAFETLAILGSGDHDGFDNEWGS